ncbi:MAG: hypothetical protein FWC40_08825, partial [Proteobacteria bacterium]|nr:hypothetical protein [Pseudomonadota bacterium]
MIDEKICKEFREQAMKLTKGMKGRTGELVAALSGYYYERREQVRQWLSLADLLESVFSDGIEPIYLAVHGREIADKAVKVARRIFESPYSMSVYRRSFHAQDWREYAPALVELMDGAYYPWGAWYAELGKSGNRLCEEGVCSTLLSEFLAMEINEGNAAVIGFVRNACLADNNVQVLTHAILLSVVKCSHVDLHRLLGDLLLAAKLQEGLRQSILENADMGSVDVLRMLMQIVHDNDLLRFSAALRALGTWMGLGYGFEDKRQAAKALRLG